MDHSPVPPPLLCEADADFIVARVSINLASRDGGNAPAVARACGCRVSADRREVTVFLARDQAETMLRNLKETGVIAAVFCRPSTHRTIQLKGTDARLAPMSPEDLALIETYRESFAADLVSVGYTRELARAVVPAPDDRVVAVTFTPSAAFDQTPGRNAGRPLK